MRVVPVLSTAALVAVALPALPALPVAGSTAGPGTDAVMSQPTPERSFCATTVLSAAEVSAGARSRVTCHATRAEAEVAAGLRPDLPGAARASSSNLWAEHYDFHGSGPSLLVSGGPTCDGSGLSFAWNDPWNDRISSTVGYQCGRIKHWQHSDRTGLAQTVTGVLQVVGLGGLMDNQTSSTSYGP